ncbi:MAG: preprotein translocase subunit SecE [Lachnospiraceae bacterium]|jgi:preprotein translocase subunit SecE|nr:preprotein translocase subunit SecE [Lachnospiraceae bacterium]
MKDKDAPKTSWFKNLKVEFSKVIWGDKKTLAQQTAAVVVVSVVLGIIIAVLDFVIQHGVDILVS